MKSRDGADSSSPVTDSRDGCVDGTPRRPQIVVLVAGKRDSAAQVRAVQLCPPECEHMRVRSSRWLHGGAAHGATRSPDAFGIIPVTFICVLFAFTSICVPVSSLRMPRQIQVFAAPVTCYNFTRGNDLLREFYSPGWPASYPNNTNCIRTISAPEQHVIQIDFRDLFELEESPNCENDYLLVRDGRETYSRELARVCGHQFPDVIRSTGNHLWLNFHADDSIQYRGFRAVYSFLANEAFTPAPECKFEVSGAEILISTANISQEFVQEAIDSEVPLDCSWRISVNQKRELQISFTEFTLFKPNECELNFVEILFGPELNLVPKARFCSSKADSVKLPNGEDVTFRYYAAPETIPSLLDEKTSVQAVATELRPRTNDEACNEDEYDCDDLYCINAELVCNGNFNCDKQLDEKYCDVGGNSAVSELLTTANIVIMVIGAALLFGLCFSVFWNCVRKLREDIREKEEYMRQSVEEMDEIPVQTIPRNRSTNTLDDGGCYVPGMSLKTGFNGRPRLVREELVDLDVDTAERECQTPGGLRRSSRDSGGSGASTPPPPPPPARPPASPIPGYRPFPAPPVPITYGAAYSVGGADSRASRPRERNRSEQTLDEFEGNPMREHSAPRRHRSGHRPEDSEPLRGVERTTPRRNHSGQRLEDCDAGAPSYFKGQTTPGRHRSDPRFDERESESPPALRSGNVTPRSYRSEAVIEMRSRPSSVQSSKSAADLVVKL